MEYKVFHEVESSSLSGIALQLKQKNSYTGLLRRGVATRSCASFTESAGRILALAIAEPSCLGSRSLVATWKWLVHIKTTQTHPSFAK